MIVPMKKVSLVVLDSHREESLEKLRDVGVLHVESVEASSEALTGLQEDRAMLERALRLLPEPKESGESADADLEKAFQTAAKVLTLSDMLQSLSEDIGRLERDEAALAEWGDFDPSDILELREKGVDLRLCRVPRSRLEEVPEDVSVFVLRETKSTLNVAVILPEGAELPFEETPLPEKGLDWVRERLSAKTVELHGAKHVLASIAPRKQALRAALEELDGQIDFETTRAGMGSEKKLAFLTGYTPVGRVETLQKAAAENGWAIMIEDPSGEDQVPTLIENPKWIRIIQPVFDLLGTIPGYREFDISFWFLGFLSFFYAIIIGDGAYGLIFLLGTFIARKKFPKAPAEPFLLLYVMSVATVIWGAVTGTWFGSQTFAQSAALSWAIHPKLSSFAADAKASRQFWMHMCFVIGAAHLTIAHLRSFARLSPSLASYTDLGWISVLWGLYFVIRWLLLEYDLPAAALVLLGGGLLVIIFFSEQEGRFWSGVFWGTVKFPLTLLDGMSCFSDTVSYVRLFAVSLAALEVAKSTNGMAAGVMGTDAAGANVVFAILLGLGAGLILLIGHTLNIVLGALSVIVHGVRLNLLEFSGHLKMEWSGNAYNPFKAKT